jgi:two-component system C4-dicarboxylate transport sensor histidine kinase DctB
MADRHHSLRFFLSDAERRAEATLAVQAAVLEQLLDKFRLMAPLLAQRPDSVRVVVNSDADLGNSVAAIAAGMAGAEEVWFLNRQGRVIAASGRVNPAETSGGEAAIPIALRQALLGQLGRQLLPGTTIRTASYVFASPIRMNNVIAGVLAVRVNLEGVEQAWALSKDQIVALDPAGSVVVTNVPTWRGKNYSGIEDQITTASVEDGEFAGPFKLGRQIRADSYIQLASNLPALGWSVLILADAAEARSQSAWAMMIAFLMCIIAGGLVWTWLTRRDEMARQLRRDKSAALRLERRVRIRTTELRKANAQLEQEVRDRLQAEADLRQAQAELVQAAKLATLGQMSAALSHEYNQPLAAIRSDAEIAEMLIARGNPDKALANLSRIGNMVARMAEIARTLKGFTRRSGTDIRPVSLRQVVDEALLLHDAADQAERGHAQDGPAREGHHRSRRANTPGTGGHQPRLQRGRCGQGPAGPADRTHAHGAGSQAVLTVRQRRRGSIPRPCRRSSIRFSPPRRWEWDWASGLSIAYKIVHDFSGTLIGQCSRRAARSSRSVCRSPDAKPIAAE